MVGNLADYEQLIQVIFTEYEIPILLTGRKKLPTTLWSG